MNPEILVFDFKDHFRLNGPSIFYDEHTYLDLYKDVVKTAMALAKHNDSFIAVQVKSPYYTFVTLLACLKLNKTAVLISHLDSPSGVELLKSQVDFTTIITDSFFENIQSGLNDFHTDFKINLKQEAAVVFSSGSSSKPKGIVLTLANFYFSAAGFIDFFKQTSKDICLINLPHHHVGGLMILWRSFFSGGIVSSNQNESIDFYSIVPTQLRKWIDNNEKIQWLKKIRVILVGGAPLDLELKEKATKYGLKLFETYGMSETASLVTANGIVLPYRKLSISKEGYFHVEGLTLSPGYYSNHQFYPHDSKGLTTKDKGTVDQLGHFQFIERTDLIFISGGENINPLLIESIACEITFVKGAYLIPIADELWGNLGVLLFQTHLQSHNEIQFLSQSVIEQISTHLKKKLHPHLLPKAYFEIPSHQETNVKVNRNDLKLIAQNLYTRSMFSFDYISSDNPKAELIVVFHGFMENKNDLKKLFNQTNTQYSYLFIDLPGHGETKIENFNSTIDIMKKITQLILSYNKEFIFYGYSMGGRIALHLALNYLPPKKLILESTGLGLKTLDDQQIRITNDRNVFTNVIQENLEEFFSKWYNTDMFNAFYLHPDYQSFIKEKLDHNYKQWEVSQKYLSSGLFPLFEETIRGLNQAPFSVSYIFGEQDRIYKFFGQALSSISSQIYEIKGSGHNPHCTHPSELKEILSVLLK